MEGKKFVNLSLVFLIIAIAVKIIFGALISAFILSSALIPIGLIGGYIFIILIILSLIFGIISLTKKLDLTHKTIAWICVGIDIVIILFILITLFVEIAVG